MISNNPKFSNFDFVRKDGGYNKLYQAARDCEEEYHSQRQRVPLTLARTAMEKLLKTICTDFDEPLPSNYRIKFAERRISSSLECRIDFLAGEQGIRKALQDEMDEIKKVLHAIRKIGNDAVHLHEVPEIWEKHEKALNRFVGNGWKYKPEFNKRLTNGICRALLKIFQDLTPLLGIETTGDEFEEPFNVINNFKAGELLSAKQLDDLRQTNAELEQKLETQNKLIFEVEEKRMKQEDLLRLWPSTASISCMKIKDNPSDYADVINLTISSKKTIATADIRKRIKDWLTRPIEDSIETFKTESDIENEVRLRELTNRHSEELNVAVEKLQQTELEVKKLKEKRKGFYDWIQEYPKKEDYGLDEEGQRKFISAVHDFLKERLEKGEPPFQQWGCAIAFHGEGAWGTAYKCYPESGGGGICVKLLKPNIKNSTNEIEKVWKKEINVVNKLLRPDLTKITGIAYPSCNLEESCFGFTIYELVEGQLLRKRLQQDKYITLPEALYLIYKISDSVEEAWQRNIWYTDFGTENIIIQNREPILIDPSPLMNRNVPLAPEWKNIKLFSEKELPLSGIYYQLGHLFLNMLDPKTSIQQFLSKSADPTNPHFVPVDEETAAAIKETRVRSILTKAKNRLEVAQKIYLDNHDFDRLIKLLIDCVHDNPDHRKYLKFGVFPREIRKYFDPLNIYAS